jgi:hypothetical protein
MALEVHTFQVALEVHTFQMALEVHTKSLGRLGPANGLCDKQQRLPSIMTTG